MIVLGIDPGATVGWCLYDDFAERVVEAGTLTDGEACGLNIQDIAKRSGHIVIERPRGYGPTRPQVVDCGWIGGRIFGEMLALNFTIEALERIEIRKRLQVATNGIMAVRNDATVWAALKLLHGGDGCDKKGGPLYGVKSHARAALAAAVAYGLPSSKEDGDA